MEPILDMTVHGVRVDELRMVSEHGRLDLAAKDIEAQIAAAAGMPLVAKKGLSNDRLKFLMYGAAGFPGQAGAAKYAKLVGQFPAVEPFNFRPITKQNAQRGRSITVDEVTLRKLILAHSDKLANLGPLL